MRNTQETFSKDIALSKHTEQILVLLPEEITQKLHDIVVTYWDSRARRKISDTKDLLYWLKCVQSNLDYPDYSIIRTFFSGPNFSMNIN